MRGEGMNHQRAAQFRVIRGQHGGDDRAVVEPNHRGSIRPSSLEDRDRVPHLCLQVRKPIEGHRVGKPGATTIEMDQTPE